jgi:hemolysin activation/secretion protein
MKTMKQMLMTLFVVCLACPGTVWTQNHAEPASSNSSALPALSTAPAPAPGTPSAGVSPASFLVTKITTSESRLLSPAEIREITGRYEQRRLTQKDLDQMVEEFNHLYAKRGFQTARAVLVAQTVNDGVVNVQLIEARVGRIVLENNTRTRASYFRARIPAYPGEVLRLGDVQQNLAYFNATTDLQMRAVMQPGQTFGTTDLALAVQGPREFEVTTFTDNAGRDTIGLYRAGANATYRSLFGKRDPLSLGFLGADGTLGANASYGIPLDRRGTKLTMLGDYNTIAIGGAVLGSTDMSGHSSDGTLMLSRPLLVRLNNILSASVAAHYKYSLLSSAGLQLTRTNVRSLELSTDFQRYDSRGSWLVRNDLNGGFYSVSGSSEFFRFNSTLMRGTTLGRNFTMITRLSGQWNALNPLPSIEQMQIGGASSVRGYSEAALAGDSGFIGSSELTFPFLRHQWATRVQAATFVDAGGVFGRGLSTATQPRDSRLLSVGFGFVAKISTRVSGRIDFGVPVRNTVGISPVGIHFSVQSTFGLPRRWSPTPRGQWATQ